MVGKMQCIRVAPVEFIFRRETTVKILFEIKNECI